MYLILVYDVEAKRVAKICKRLRQRLNWVQNSVFEGEVTEADFSRIRHDLAKLMDLTYDSVLFYRIDNPKGWSKEVLGVEKLSTETLI